MKIGPCLICQTSSASWLCETCEKRAEPVYKLEPIAVFCPVEGCGFAPLEDEGFTRLFPDKADKRSSPESRVLIVYSETGCHRCAERLNNAHARVYELKPRAS